MKKVFKFVKGKKEERREGGGPPQSGDAVSPARTPEDEGFLGVDDPSGYDVDFGGKDKTLTKLHKAAWQGNLEKLKSALKKIEVDAVDRRNRTALHFAVARGHPNIVWFLLGNNADASVADDDGHTPLLKAIECGNKDCMNLLLDRGADVNAADYTGNTGLHVAVDRSSLDTATALLKKGADTEVSNNAGDYPLHVATRLENKDMVDLLLDAGASVDVLDRENRTPLMLAAKTGNCLLATIFVERGAQLTVVDSNGWTAQDYAMLGGHETVSAALKSFSKKITQDNGKTDSVANEDVPATENGQTETSEEEVSIPLPKAVFEKHSWDESEMSEKEKNEDLPESPEADAIPPYCQPPRSWEMIQAGMIDENKNRIEPKRRSITTLGTLSSRRESFTDSSAPTPLFTLSLNRRKGPKGNNDFARQRFSFNEEESLKFWINEEKTIRKEIETVELENVSALGETKEARRPFVPEGDQNGISEEKSRDLEKMTRPDSASVGSHEMGDGNSESGSGTFGRSGTMREVEEMWVACPAPASGDDQANSWDSEDASSEKEGSFPPPPTALELGIDMAKSIKYMKGISMDRPPSCGADRNLWKDVRERRSLDFTEERGFADLSKGNEVKTRGRPPSTQRGEDVPKCQRPTDRFPDVSKRIKEELECYDQALRELAESTGSCKKSPNQNYHSLPSVKSGGGGECRRSFSQELPSSPRGPLSLPFFMQLRSSETAEAVVPAEESPIEKADERPKTKRHMLLAMRDVKHAVHVTGSFKTSLDDQILSPLTKPEDAFDVSSPRGRSGSSGGDSPIDEENPFFGVGRQQTVLERNGTGRKSSSSGEESTLWLQDDARRRGLPSPDSEDDVPDLAADERPKHQRPSSFSPLAIIQKEMEEESRSAEQDGPGSSPAEDFARDERQEDVFREPSPDISLSSGPIEPIGEDKDSGSDPESSRNDVSPSHDQALKSQHEWLKCHLKAATTEKNKLEELSARLAEKAERLQYELADAREAAKSRDEVIRLLQGQLARMEAAYTRSLEESVQSRLQLTSREQEILHLKELCFRHEEEKEAAAAAAAGGGCDFLQELKARIKMLEGEKEKMREEISHLEEEKAFLEKRLKQGKNEEAEIVEECQRWKERCRKLEELAKAHERPNDESCGTEDRERLTREVQLRQQNFDLEQKYMRLDEENERLEAKIRCLAAELDAEKKKTSAAREEHESIAELKQKNHEMEIRLRKAEKDAEENLVKMLKKKEEEVESLVRQFDRERENLVACYEKKLAEGSRGRERPDAEEWERGNRRLRRAVESLRDQMITDRMRMNASVEDAHATLKREFRRLQEEWDSVSRSIAETQNRSREPNARNSNFSNRETEEDVEGGEPKGEIFRALLDDEVARSRRKSEAKRQEGDGKRRSVGKEDELAWSSLYGMGVAGRRRSGRLMSATEELKENGDNISESKKRKRLGEDILNRLMAASEQESEASEKQQKFEFLELKKEILSLQSKMLDEKNLRHALENQMIKMNLDLSEKDNLEKEVNSLKKKFEGDCMRKSEMELLEYRKDLEAKREKYLAGAEEKPRSDDYKTICEIWAKESEKSKQMRSAFVGTARSFDRPPSPDVEFRPRPRPRPDLVLQPRLVTLDPVTKNKLERELDMSIEKYVRSESKRGQS